VKFASDLDAQLFLMEIGETSITEATKELEPTDEQMGTFISRRKALEGLIKSHRKSQIQKGNWRKNRTKMMKGIKAFHKSTEGKRFHRNLGNFLATRMTSHDTGRSSLRTNEDFEHLKALNSAKTHLYIELEYYHQVYEQVELEEFALDYAYELFRSIEKKILNDTKLSESEIQFLFDITESTALIKSFAEKSGKSIDDVEGLWKETKQELIKKGKNEDDEGFYPTLVTILKNKLKLS
jgi:hypothetical protein